MDQASARVEDGLVHLAESREVWDTLGFLGQIEEVELVAGKWTEAC